MTKFLRNDKQEFILSKQILRSGTAIGALVRESEFAQSRLDFINKLSVALKETNETGYWLNLLKDSDYITHSSFESIATDCGELIALLVSSIKTVKKQPECRIRRITPTGNSSFSILNSSLKNELI